MHALIISGGTVDPVFARQVIRAESFDLVVAADAGTAAAKAINVVPDLVVGDFDSADPAVVDELKKDTRPEWITLNPQKDDTDSEHALREAIRRGAEDILILGATGTRLDHVLGNIGLLGIGLEEKVRVCLSDAHNRIRMIDDRLEIVKGSQFGKYLSLIPYMGPVEGVTAEGVKYPLCDYTLEGFNTLGISNEIVGEKAMISVKKGTLLVIESKD